MSSPADSPLLVVALGGNAISPPREELSFAGERRLIHQAIAELAAVATGATRLLIIHGNGPQVGRLLNAPPSPHSSPRTTSSPGVAAA